MKMLWHRAPAVCSLQPATTTESLEATAAVVMAEAAMDVATDRTAATAIRTRIWGRAGGPSATSPTLMPSKTTTNCASPKADVSARCSSTATGSGRRWSANGTRCDTHAPRPTFVNWRTAGSQWKLWDCAFQSPPGHRNTSEYTFVTSSKWYFQTEICGQSRWKLVFSTRSISFASSHFKFFRWLKSFSRCEETVFKFYLTSSSFLRLNPCTDNKPLAKVDCCQHNDLTLSQTRYKRTGKRTGLFATRSRDKLNCCTFSLRWKHSFWEALLLLR